MKLLLVNQYYWPDRAATAQLLGDLAEAAADTGIAVEVLCGRAVYAPGTGPLSAGRSIRNGVTVRRVWTTAFGRGRLLHRLLDAVTFLFTAGSAMVFGSRPDVVICLSSPPMVACLGLLGRLRGARWINKVEDLYPDIAVALGALGPRSPLTRALTALSRLLLRRAEVCVALDPAMARSLERRGAGRVEVIPNWADGRAIRPDAAAGRRFRAEHGLDGGFLVLYSGNLGLAHRFDAVADAICRLSGVECDPTFLFVGAGPRLAEVRTWLAGRTEVRFLPYQPRERLHELYNAADIHLITLHDEVAELLVPSKYSAALAAGKPVLLVGGASSELGREIADREVGWTCAHDADRLAALLGRAMGASAERQCMGRRARQLFDEKYARDSLVEAWLELIRRQ